MKARSRPDAAALQSSHGEMKIPLKTVLALVTLSLLLPGALICAVAAGTTNATIAAQIQRLQGTWQGVQVGHESAGKYTVTIAGNSLRYQGLNTNEWYHTTFTLPEGTNPQQLHATITAGPQREDAGKVVFTIFKIEADTLTLVGIEASATAPPKTFREAQPQFKLEPGTFNLAGSELATPDPSKAFEDDSTFRYDLKKVPAQKPDAAPPKSR